jgi:hypothetical protein
MRKFCLALTLFCSVSGYGQVNLPTGAATFSLPIFKWQDNKSRLNTIVDLEYNSGNGLKVNDVASDIGQGWSLIAGGSITRIQAGEPDDQQAFGSTSPEDITKYPAGYLYGDHTAGYSDALKDYPVFPDKNHIYKQDNQVATDKEIDQFAFQFNGRSGIFVIGRNSYGGLGPVTLGDTKLRIWFDKDPSMINDSIRTTISDFYIQDENGLIYEFAQHELTRVLETEYTNASLTRKIKQPKLGSGDVRYESMFDEPNDIRNPWIINGWYLTKITDPLTLNTITFQYNTRNIIADAGNSISYYHPGNYTIVSHSISVSKTPRISSISIYDGHQINFNYGAARFDLPGDYALSSLDIKYQNMFLSKYVFNEGYIMRNRFGSPVSVSEKKEARLYLKSVQKVGVDLKAEDAPYSFDYWLGSGTTGDFVPPPFFHLKDNWGYYNGDQSKAVNNTVISVNSSPFKMSNVQLKGLCFLHDGVSGITLCPKDGYAKNGLLKQINYPTGGSLNYDYEQNKALVNGQDISVGGVHVSKTTITDGGYSNDCNNPIVTNYSYKDVTGTHSSLWGFEMPLNSQTLSNRYTAFEKHFKWNLICKYKYRYPGILSRDNSVALTTGQQILQVLSVIGNVVGTVSEIIDVVKFIASATGPAAVIIDAIATAVNIVISCFNSPTKTSTTTIYYNSDLIAGNPLPLQFKRVEVYKNSGSDGKIVYEFTSSDDYAIWQPSNPTYSMMQRYASWAYGLPKTTTVYDLGNNVKTETINYYDYSHAKSTFFCKSCGTDYMSYKALVLKNYAKSSHDWINSPTSTTTTNNLSTSSDMMVQPYDAYTGRTLLDSTVERVFKDGDQNQYLQTNTKYYYNNGDDDPFGNYEVNQIKTIESNGDMEFKTFRYNNSFLTQHHILNTPFETTTSFQRKGEGTRYYTGESVTEYTSTDNGNIVPARTLTQRFAVPVPESAMVFYDYENSSYNPPYKETQTFVYDANSNLSGLKDEGNRVVTNIYGYNDKYVVANIINADPDADKSAFTSFETDDFTRSGWTMNGAAVYSSNAITGSRSLTLSSGKSLSAVSLNTAKAYRLSFWASNSGISVSGNATLVKSAPAKNGFTYYEYNIAQGTSSVTLTGSANIDELRLYPQSARMRTVTYDALIGKTSECDENNRITYYEYDELGRMRFIKDEDKNIVKMYEYNVKNKSTACQVTYHNPEISEVFTRNNCGAGYAGSEVTYVIPDSKYTSIVSQDEVDQQVQADLNSFGQNFANTNGTCQVIYSNVQLSTTLTKEGCDVGYKGTNYIYTVPAGTYTSLISQADADQQAQDEIDANGQAYANLPGNASCVIDTNPDWDADENAPSQCQVINGTSTGHRLIEMKDINPNSPTYNQTQWVDEGLDPSCTVSNCHFSATPGFTLVAGSIYYTGSQVSFYIVFHANTSAYWTSPNHIADILGGCFPSADRTLSMSESGRTWSVVISHTGSVTVQLVSGTPPTGTTTIALTGGAFNL